ncbi:hypothetical protein RB195_016905 [Necator americanus]|uniref:Major facilitator superfamily (MFS) profile domain-containing protein n=1 Tax=Necator americanus TaxID=51031 RepID=A0ABR1C2P4_NECAM
MGSFGVELRRLGGEESPKVIFEVVTIIVALLFQVMLKRSEEVVVARGHVRAVRCENKTMSENCTRVGYTAVDRWGIEGDKAWIKGAVQSFYYVGHMAGSLAWGVWSDKIGRKQVFCIAVAIEILFGILLIVAPTWWLFAIFKLGTGFAHPGIYVVAIVIGTELIGARHRRIVAVLAALFGAIGELILVGLAYFIRDYRVLHAAIALPWLILISYWWLMPESLRWLVTNERYREADVIMRKAAKVNKSNIPDKWWEQLEKSQSKKNTSYGLLDLFRTKTLRIRSLVCFFIWPVNAMLFYGLTMKSDIGGGSIYVNFALSAAIEIPAIFVVYFLIDRIGRRWMVACSFFVAGICLVINLFVGDHVAFYWGMLQIMITKGAVTSAFIALYTYTSELFPTVIRNTAMGSCSTMARLGSILSSFIALWLVDNYGKLSLVIPFSVLALASAVMTAVLLPETVNKPMHETIAEVEDATT